MGGLPRQRAAEAALSEREIHVLRVLYEGMALGGPCDAALKPRVSAASVLAELEPAPVAADRAEKRWRLARGLGLLREPVDERIKQLCKVYHPRGALLRLMMLDPEELLLVGRPSVLPGTLQAWAAKAAAREHAAVTLLDGAVENEALWDGSKLRSRSRNRVDHLLAELDEAQQDWLSSEAGRWLLMDHGPALASEQRQSAENFRFARWLWPMVCELDARGWTERMIADLVVRADSLWAFDPCPVFAQRYREDGDLCARFRNYRKRHRATA